MAITKKQQLELAKSIKALEAMIHNYTSECSVFTDDKGATTQTATHERVSLYLRSWVLKPLVRVRDYKPNRRLN